MKEISKKWGIPTFGTELGCGQFWAAKNASISHSYWHYSDYCNTRPEYFGNIKIPEESFGACILGWGSGRSDGCTTPSASDKFDVENVKLPESLKQRLKPNMDVIV